MYVSHTSFHSPIIHNAILGSKASLNSCSEILRWVTSGRLCYICYVSLSCCGYKAKCTLPHYCLQALYGLNYPALWFALGQYRFVFLLRSRHLFISNFLQWKYFTNGSILSNRCDCAMLLTKSHTFHHCAQYWSNTIIPFLVLKMKYNYICV